MKSGFSIGVVAALIGYWALTETGNLLYSAIIFFAVSFILLWVVERYD